MGTVQRRARAEPRGGARRRPRIRPKGPDSDRLEAGRSCSFLAVRVRDVFVGRPLGCLRLARGSRLARETAERRSFGDPLASHLFTHVLSPRLVHFLPIRLSPTATSGSVRPCSWTFTSVAIFGSHNRCQSSSDFSLTMRPVPATWRRLAGATGSFAPIVRRRESRSASQIVLASCAAASAAVTPD